MFRQMFGAKDIVKEARVVANANAGPLIEISFRGKHWDGCGNELIDYVSQAVQELKPAGIVMNLAAFQYRWGNDIGALLFPLLDEQSRQLRPFCIVATGRTARSLKSLFAFMAPDLVNTRYFDDARDGLAYLKNKLGGDSV